MHHKSFTTYIISALLCLATIKAKSQVNYEIGDTLSVVALGGINLRQEAGTSFDKVSKLDNGDLVIVKRITESMDSIEFLGNWVEVISVNNSAKGYAFDAFLSKYRVVNDLSEAKRFRNTYDFIDRLPTLLNEYSEKAFNNSGCDIEYTSTSSGESYHALAIKVFDEDCRLIKHQFYEGGKSELELLNARPSESYYLVKNIIKQLPIDEIELIKVNENTLMFPKVKNWKNCSVKFESGDCLIDVYKKGKGITSINFNFPCC